MPLLHSIESFRTCIYLLSMCMCVHATFC